MAKLELILGGPGAGKTTELLRLVEQELSHDVSSREIAFVSFTKAAAQDGAAKAASKFQMTPEELPWFRTIHSLAYSLIGVSRGEVVDHSDWAAFADLIGVSFSHMSSPDELGSFASGTDGDKLLRIVDYAATTRRSLREVWHELNEAVAWEKVEQFAAAWTAYKKDAGKFDFNDMLSQYIEDGKPIAVRVAFIDEAQDLTAAQWAVVRRAFRNVERVYICGDDDQAIYKWAGADVSTFLSLASAPRVLERCWRLSPAVFAYSQTIVQKISQRYAKPYAPDDHEGTVEWHMDPSLVDYTHEGSWLLLARNRYMLTTLQNVARDLGMNYEVKGRPAVEPEDVVVMRYWERINKGHVKDVSANEFRAIAKALGHPAPTLRELTRYQIPTNWPVGTVWYQALLGIPEDRRNYYLTCLRRGEALHKPPRVRIDTIHGVKGSEADNVVLMSDVSEKTWKSYLQDPDHEHRVFYVGATRARRSLHLIRPQSARSYPL